MTDNRTTELTVTERLRALLTERGIKFKAWDGVHPITVWHDEQFSYEYTERSLLNGAKPHTGEVLDGTGFLKAVIHVCTPEQAIAATLGSGTLTAEQVRKCVRVGACDHGLWGALDEDTDWQAIADELNAELRSGTCEIEPIFPKAPDGTQLFGFRCKSCGFYQATTTKGLEAAHRQWSFCPNCGKRVSA